MKKHKRNSESGVALVMSILALMVLSAIAVGLVYMTNIETQVNANYRQEQVAYFAAKAGMEEARDRMMLNQAGTYYFSNMTPNPLPAAVPTDTNNGVLYIVNEGTQPGTVQPWAAGSTYMDDELCHDGYTLTGLPSGGNVPSSDIHCTAQQMPSAACTPPAPCWYQSTTSQLPYNGTAAALPFKWVRVALKLNGSVQGTPQGTIPNNYMVNPSQPATTPVCWGNGTEVLMTGTSCQTMNPATTPVYLLTALAVSSTGARKMVQAEVAANPAYAFPYGLFGTGTGCGVVSFTGNGATGSFDGSKGAYSSTNSSSTGGDIGSNGNVTLAGGAQIGGSVGVLPPSMGGSVTEGACPGSNYTVNGGNAGIVSNPNNVLTPLAGPVLFNAPPPPAPPPPTAPLDIQSDTSLVPGTYGSISGSGKATITLAPGVYNINSLQLSGQAQIVITPVGQVVLNIAGACAPTPCSPGTVLDLSGNSVNNQSFNANQFQINYGGSGQINVTGNASSTYFILNAPNAGVKIAGNGNIYGAVVGKTITDVGNGGFYYDTSAKLAPASNGTLNLLSFRHIPY